MYLVLILKDKKNNKNIANIYHRLIDNLRLSSNIKYSCMRIFNRLYNKYNNILSIDIYSICVFYLRFVRDTSKFVLKNHDLFFYWVKFFDT